VLGLRCPFTRWHRAPARPGTRSATCSRVAIACRAAVSFSMSAGERGEARSRESGHVDHGRDE
jgi:hypothetical protein